MACRRAFLVRIRALSGAEQMTYQYHTLVAQHVGKLIKWTEGALGDSPVGRVQTGPRGASPADATGVLADITKQYQGCAARVAQCNCAGRCFLLHCFVCSSRSQRPRACSCPIPGTLGPIRFHLQRTTRARAQGTHSVTPTPSLVLTATPGLPQTAPPAWETQATRAVPVEMSIAAQSRRQRRTGAASAGSGFSSAAELLRTLQRGQ